MCSFSGAQVVEGCEVTGVLAENGAVKEVTTNLGKISCEYFINCAGLVSVVPFALCCCRNALLVVVEQRSCKDRLQENSCASSSL